MVLTARRDPTITAPLWTNRQLETHNVTVHFETVWGRLVEAVYSWRPIRVQALRDGNHSKTRMGPVSHRLDRREWSNVFFSEKPRLGFHPDSRQVRVCRSSSNKEGLRCPQEVHQYQEVTIVVWDYKWLVEDLTSFSKTVLFTPTTTYSRFTSLLCFSLQDQ